MPETMQDLLLKYPPREIDPVEREHISEWLARAQDASSAYVSDRKTDDLNRSGFAGGSPA